MKVEATAARRHTITTGDGTEIFFKDWGTGQPIVFSHGSPLNSDAWEDQMVFLADRGYRCMPTISPHSSRNWISTMPFTSGTRWAAARWRATLAATARHARRSLF